MKAAKTFLLSSLSSFACPKEETRKRHPSQSWPCGLPLLLDEGGTRKNSGFALRQFPRLFRPRLRGATGQMGGEERIPHWHAAEHRRGCRKGDLHCLSAASLQSPGSLEERRASRQRRDKGHRGPFLLVRFLWASKENEQTNFIQHTPQFPNKPFYPGQSQPANDTMPQHQSTSISIQGASSPCC